MKKTLFLFGLLVSLSVVSQEKFSREFKLQSDNDVYVSTYNDRYYTNGLFLSYKYLSQKKSDNLSKKIIEWKIGHEMYTPFSALVVDISQHDRPFAAYLFGSFSHHYVFKNKQNLKIGVQLGTIGNNAFGKELQAFVHEIYGFKKATGWKYQIKNALGLNIDMKYVNPLHNEESSNIDFNLIATTRIGTVFTDASIGFLSRIGFIELQNIANSIVLGTNINDENTNFKREREAFLFLKPTLHYILYDATIQGSFLNTTSPVTKEPVNLKLGFEIGIQFTSNRFNFAYVVNFQTKKIENLNHPIGNYYGKVSVGYLLD